MSQYKFILCVSVFAPGPSHAVHNLAASSTVKCIGDSGGSGRRNAVHCALYNVFMQSSGAQVGGGAAWFGRKWA